ncbi:hypothetical protein PM082_010852 [Marasmius tenuissimus]|nr:hypothetical protein PM082_010852 [Marasmius tenuissimus]
MTPSNPAELSLAPSFLGSSGTYLLILFNAQPWTHTRRIYTPRVHARSCHSTALCLPEGPSLDQILGASHFFDSNPTYRPTKRNGNFGITTSLSFGDYTCRELTTTP